MKTVKAMKRIFSISLAFVTGVTVANAGAVDVTAGSAIGIEGDIAVDSKTVLQFIDSGAFDGTIYIVLDSGSVKTVGKIINVNRAAATASAAKHVEVMVAEDESAFDFNPNLAASFKKSVYNGVFRNVTTKANAVRTAPFEEPVSRRYFLLKYIDNCTGPISPAVGVVPGQTDRVQLSDLQVGVTE